MDLFATITQRNAIIISGNVNASNVHLVDLPIWIPSVLGLVARVMMLKFVNIILLYPKTLTWNFFTILCCYVPDNCIIEETKIKILQKKLHIWNSIYTLKYFDKMKQNTYYLFVPLSFYYKNDASIKLTNI